MHVQEILTYNFFLADMSNKKLVPYIDLIVRHPIVHKGASSKHVHSPSPSVSSPLTPRKKRKLEDDKLSEDFAYMVQEFQLYLCCLEFRFWCSISVHRNKGQPFSTLIANSI